jgi:hypothetical protein
MESLLSVIMVHDTQQGSLFAERLVKEAPRPSLPVTIVVEGETNLYGRGQFKKQEWANKIGDRTINEINR